MYDGRMSEFASTVAAARRGDRAARARLHDRYRSLVAAAVRRRLGPELRRHVDTDDLVQTVFVATLANLADVRAETEPEFRHLLLLRVENGVRDHLRRLLGPSGRRRTSRLATRPPLADRGRTPSSWAGQRDEAGKLSTLLERLDPVTREVVRLRSDGDVEFAEIARRVGLRSADAARKRYARALLALREQWGPG